MARRSPSLLARLHYAFDSVMAMGWLAQIGLVLVVYAALIVLATLVLVLGDVHPEGRATLTAPESVWQTVVHAINTGPVSRAEGWGFRAVMLAISLVGLFTTLTMTGIVTSAIGRKLQELRRGRSVVLEEGHTLILGWSPGAMTILDELVKANAHRPRHRIVILAERDQLELEEAIRDHEGLSGRTRVICRTGSPIRAEDLAIVNPEGAQAIVILAPPPAAGIDPDIHVVRTILALVDAPGRKAGPYHIVAEIRDPAKLEVARLVGGSEVELVAPTHVIPHLIVQTSLQPGLSSVYRALFRYEGSEIYFRSEPTAVGRTFGETQLMYENAVVMGLRHADGGFTLLPPPERRIEAGERLIALAETSDAFRLHRPHAVKPDEAAIHGLPLPAPGPRSVLVLGWSPLGPALVRELDHYVLAGSRACVVAPPGEPLAPIEALGAGLSRLKLTSRAGLPTDRATLEALGIPAYDHVILLAPTDVQRPEEADARTLVALVQLRALLGGADARCTIASEIHDDVHVDLAGLARVDDFVVGDTLISMMLAQIAENKDLNAIFADLLNAQGAELVLRPAGHYVALGRPISFETVVAAVAGHGEAVLGYRRQAAPGDEWRGVVLNPRKHARLTLTADDHLIVLSRGNVSGAARPAVAAAEAPPAGA